MSSKRIFTCIVCPNGCTIETEYEGSTVESIIGNRCKRGAEYVTQELIDPKRTIASTVRIYGASLPLCSVRLDKPIPKREIFRVMEEINKCSLQAPVRIGQVVIENVCGLDSNVIVTKNFDKIN